MSRKVRESIVQPPTDTTFQESFRKLVEHVRRKEGVSNITWLAFWLWYLNSHFESQVDIRRHDRSNLQKLVKICEILFYRKNRETTMSERVDNRKCGREVQYVRFNDFFCVCNTLLPFECLESQRWQEVGLKLLESFDSKRVLAIFHGVISSIEAHEKCLEFCKRRLPSDGCYLIRLVDNVADCRFLLCTFIDNVFKEIPLKKMFYLNHGESLENALIKRCGRATPVPQLAHSFIDDLYPRRLYASREDQRSDLNHYGDSVPQDFFGGSGGGAPSIAPPQKKKKKKTQREADGDPRVSGGRAKGSNSIGSSGSDWGVAKSKSRGVNFEEMYQRRGKSKKQQKKIMALPRNSLKQGFASQQKKLNNLTGVPVSAAPSAPSAPRGPPNPYSPSEFSSRLISSNIKGKGYSAQNRNRSATKGNALNKGTIEGDVEETYTHSRRAYSPASIARLAGERNTNVDRPVPRNAAAITKGDNKTFFEQRALIQSTQESLESLSGRHLMGLKPDVAKALDSPSSLDQVALRSNYLVDSGKLFSKSKRKAKSISFISAMKSIFAISRRPRASFKGTSSQSSKSAKGLTSSATGEPEVSARDGTLNGDLHNDVSVENADLPRHKIVLDGKYSDIPGQNQDSESLLAEEFSNITLRRRGAPSSDSDDSLSIENEEDGDSISLGKHASAHTVAFVVNEYDDLSEDDDVGEDSFVEQQEYTPLEEECEGVEKSITDYEYTPLEEDEVRVYGNAKVKTPSVYPGANASIPPFSMKSDNVRWSIMAPRSVTHMCSFTISVHAYLRQQRNRILNSAKQDNHVEKGMRMKDTVLGRGAPVTVVLYISDSRISVENIDSDEIRKEDSYDQVRKKQLTHYSTCFQKFKWTGEPHKCTFQCRANFFDFEEDKSSNSRKKSFFIPASAKILSGKEAFEIPFQIQVHVTSEFGFYSAETGNNKEIATCCVDMSNKLQRIDFEDLSIKEEIGSGEFSKAYRAEMVLKSEDTEHDSMSGRWLPDQVIEVAVKEIDTSHPNYDQNLTLNEIQLCQLLGNHPNVATFIGAGGFHDYNDESEAITSGQVKPFVVTEYYHNGSIRNFLDSRNPVADSDFSSPLTIQMSIDALTGVQHLHEANVVHRDIASRNFLLDRNYRSVVSDFGLSVKSDPLSLEGVHFHSRREYLPLKNMAPEALECNTRISSFKTDAFMCGYLLWEIHTGGCHPWSGITAVEAAKLVLEGKRPNYNRILNGRIRSLVEKCWRANPEDRASVGTTLKGLEALLP